MATSRGILLVPALEAAFLKAAIESGNNDRAKRALQALCKLYWGGSRLLPGDLIGIENTVLGALSRGNSDEKVRRWCLSLLAQLGRSGACWDAVISALERYQYEPQVVSAAIAAAFKLDPRRAQDALIKLDFVSPEFLALSALQSVRPDRLSGNLPIIDVERASITTLKLSMILVGLNRAPPNLLHPKLGNSELVRALGTHHDTLVSQYSIWATAENPNLSAKDLGIDPTTVESRPDNIRSYIFRLFASESEHSDLRHQLLEIGSKDPAAAARIGCAIGLRDAWYDGIEPIVTDWFFEEDDPEARKYLLVHLVRQADQSTIYRDTAISLYTGFENDLELRMVMRAAAEGKGLFQEFKKIDYEEEFSLFSPRGAHGVTNNNNITINTSGTTGQVVVSGSGEALNSGAALIRIDAAGAVNAIRDARDLLAAQPLNSDLLALTHEKLDEAEKDPSPENLKVAVGFLEKCKEGLEAADGLAAAAIKLGGTIALILQGVGLVG